jgi:hypothetical protein
MFAERIYLKAYQRGVFAAAEKFCVLYAEGCIPAGGWPFPKSDASSLVRDLVAAGDQIMHRRLTALAYAGSRNEWRHLSEALRRRSGIFLRADVQSASDGNAPVSVERSRFRRVR